MYTKRCYFCSLLNQNCYIRRLIQQSLAQDEVDGEHPPPLPDKEKRRSQVQNMLEMVYNAGLHGQLTPTSQSPRSSMMSANTSLLDCSLGSSQSSLLNQSDCSSPMSKSPTSSFGSGLNHSAEELNGEQRTQRANTFSKTSSDSKLVNRNVKMSQSHSECTVNQINQLTEEINKLTKLTADMEAITRRNKNKGEGPPPLPNKSAKLNRMLSSYDNVPDVTQLDSYMTSSSGSRTVISRTVTSRISQTSQSSEARLSSSSTSSTQSFSGVQMQKSNTISFSQRTSSQDETYSSSGSFSSGSHSSMEIPRPPPLPPKQRHSKCILVLG